MIGYLGKHNYSDSALIQFTIVVVPLHYNNDGIAMCHLRMLANDACKIK